MTAQAKSEGRPKLYSKARIKPSISGRALVRSPPLAVMAENNAVMKQRNTCICSAMRDRHTAERKAREPEARSMMIPRSDAKSLGVARPNRNKVMRLIRAIIKAAEPAKIPTSFLCSSEA